MTEKYFMVLLSEADLNSDSLGRFPECWLLKQRMLNADELELIKSALWLATDQWWDMARDEQMCSSMHEDDREAALFGLRSAKAGEALLEKLGHKWQEVRRRQKDGQGRSGEGEGAPLQQSEG